MRQTPPTTKRPKRCKSNLWRLCRLVVKGVWEERETEVMSYDINDQIGSREAAPPSAEVESERTKEEKDDDDATRNAGSR
jgi:hypothetical protein